MHAIIARAIPVCDDYHLYGYNVHGGLCLHWQGKKLDSYYTWQFRLSRLELEFSDRITSLTLHM